MFALKLILLVAVFLHSSVNCQNFDPPEGNTEFLKVHGVASINYVCKNGQFLFGDASGELQELTDLSIKVGGFSYSSLTAATFNVGGNSSAVTFTQTLTSPSSNQNSLPNALFSVTGNTGPGNLEGATFVQRTNTLSGLAPGPNCAEGNVIKAVFRATYRFFKRSLDERNKIRPPISSVFLMTTQGTGTYNYVCKNNQWVYVDVNGNLSPIGNPAIKRGTFFVSPTPDANGGRNVFTIDASSVTFKTNTTAFTRIPGSIPEVLYSTTSTKPGPLEGVKFGQRINASGGNIPALPCNEGKVSNVPFKTEFVFYV